MIIQNKDESRKDYLLRVAAEFINMNKLEEFELDYDGTTCDGYCLIGDIEAELNNK